MAASQAGDHRVVAGGVGEGFLREPAPQAEGGGSGAARELGEEAVVVAWIDQYGQAAEVLGRRPDHRRAADVDHLDRLRLGDSRARDGAFERVEIDRHEIEACDAVFRQRRGVRRLRPVGEDAAVNPRVERLDAAVEDLGEAGDFGDAGDGEPGRGEVPPGATGRDELEAEGGESAGELDQTGLVGNGEQGAGGGRHLQLLGSKGTGSERRFNGDSAAGAGVEQDQVAPQQGELLARVGPASRQPDVSQGARDVRNGMAVGDRSDGESGRAVIEGARACGAADPTVLLGDRGIEPTAPGEGRRGPGLDVPRTPPRRTEAVEDDGETGTGRVGVVEEVAEVGAPPRGRCWRCSEAGWHRRRSGRAVPGAPRPRRTADVGE